MVPRLPKVYNLLCYVPDQKGSDYRFEEMICLQVNYPEGGGGNDRFRYERKCDIGTRSPYLDSSEVRDHNLVV